MPDRKFDKLVAIEPLGLVESAEDKLKEYAREVVLYTNLPADNDEIIHRIGNADAILLSYTSQIDESVIEACPSIRYIGMCCSLYSPESANVDIRAANARGITVYGVRDYGDQGVVEYAVYQLVSYLHGYGGKKWRAESTELTDLKIGVVGLGTTGQMIADAMMFLGANLYYYSRTQKPQQEAKGIKYLSLKELLQTVDVVFSCLNKNVILFYEEQFEWFGDNKIMFNTSIGPSHDTAALTTWLAHGGNEFFCDTAPALGGNADALLSNPHVTCVGASAGRTSQAFVRLSEKVLDNIEAFLQAR